ncbi:hypothetical protein [Shewanella gaetbuli]|uniref:Uncharacterized protein n=1 Tax=Shewanella gaetbuli TaxID=220752 RepID=A0A9X1ZN49_9GAMM|nr:hypothetical protein [Shewanella gaetbuli]MCL1142965.1 hypothetical protein [Shewanella gaetbuli]
MSKHIKDFLPKPLNEDELNFIEKRGVESGRILDDAWSVSESARKFRIAFWFCLALCVIPIYDRENGSFFWETLAEAGPLLVAGYMAVIGFGICWFKLRRESNILYRQAEAIREFPLPLYEIAIWYGSLDGFGNFKGMFMLTHNGQKISVLYPSLKAERNEDLVARGRVRMDNDSDWREKTKT